MISLPLPLMLLALAALYLGERALIDATRGIANGLGVALLVASLVLSAWRWRRSTAERRQAHRNVFLCYVVVLAGLALYAVQTPELDLVTSNRLRTLLLVGWPGCILLGLLPAIAMELAIGSMQRTPKLELTRVHLAARAAAIMVLAVIGFAGLNFAASTWSRKVDLSYFKTTQVGTSTRAIVHNLTKPVHFTLFFPPGNEVLERALGYIDELKRVSPQIEVEVTDQAFEPEKARDLKVRSNGYLAMQCGDKSELLRLELDVEEARGTLRKLDSEVQQRLLKIIRPPRVAYVTTGHMERDLSPTSDDVRPGLADFKALLESQGFSVRRLGLAEGLANDIPADASLVAVLGPTEEFAANERDALSRYLARGGRALIGMDPDHGVTDDALLAPLGVQVSRTLVANERYTVRVAGQGESPLNLVTTRTAHHPTVSTVEQSSNRMGVVFLGVGHLTKVVPAPANVDIAFILHSMAQSWDDLNGNSKFDAALEKRDNMPFAAAIEQKIKPLGPLNPNGQADGANEPPTMRAVVVADADFAANGVMRNPGNAYFVMDTVRWLAHAEAEAGTVESEVDVPQMQRKDENAMWFYGTSFIMPVAILLGGLGYTRRLARPRSRK